MPRIAFLVSHPTQFEVPFYKYQCSLHLSGDSDIIFDVFFLKTSSVKDLFDPEIGGPPGWDFNDKEGYRHYEVPCRKLDRFKYFWKKLVAEEYDIIIINGYFKNDIWFHIFQAKVKKIPIVLRLDSILLSQKNKWKKIVKKILLPRFFCFFDAFLAVGSLSRQTLVYYGVPEKKIFLFPYAVDNDRFSMESGQARENKLHLRELYGLPREAVVFIAVIKFVAREGVFDLLKAFAVLKRIEPKVVLLLVGDGPQRQAVREMIEKEKLTNVIQVGYQPYSQLPILYGISDAFIHPPHEECWGVSVNEAMACGLPVILSNMVGSGADLLDGNGFKYTAGAVEELVSHILALTRHEELRIEMGKRSSEIIEKWHFQGTVSQLENLVHFLKRSINIP